ncbi:hypothetical protein K9M59_00125 [Candidatus Gracilibacteria bacterium]|nr:hypothetical protein [Candidatus Gracilibacteria bacterium]MCF7818992.1 hypothetical protein [Candidatus Gracilibacteria bacterium]
MEIAIFLGLGILIILLGVVFLCFRKKVSLPSDFATRTIHQIKNTHNLDPAHALLESHKIFVSALETLFPNQKNMTAAETISKIAPRFTNEHDIWKFHRIRNKIAHEPGIRISYEDSHAARQAFIRALRSVTKS